MDIKLGKMQKIRIYHPDDIYHILQQILLREQTIDRDREHLWVIGLSNSTRILYIELVSMGTIKGTMVEPMEVFSLALQKRSVKIILAHNHPSGELVPSEADKNITDHLIQVGLFLKVPIMDHIIITTRSYYSFEQSGLLAELGKSKRYLLPYIEEKRLNEKLKEIGRQERNKEIAREMKSRGMDIKSISSITGLTELEIKRLRAPKESKAVVENKTIVKKK
jgi:DNA repair protein RadC